MADWKKTTSKNVLFTLCFKSIFWTNGLIQLNILPFNAGNTKLFAGLNIPILSCFYWKLRLEVFLLLCKYLYHWTQNIFSRHNHNRRKTSKSHLLNIHCFGKMLPFWRRMIEDPPNIINHYDLIITNYEKLSRTFILCSLGFYRYSSIFSNFLGLTSKIFS